MRKPCESLSHEQANELLPWLANGTLSAEETQAVIEHTRFCVTCRRDVAEIDALRTKLTTSQSREPPPEPDMRHINRRIDDAARGWFATDVLSPFRFLFRKPVHAALAAQTLVVLALAGILLMTPRDPVVFTTLTNDEELLPGEYLRVAVDPAAAGTALNDLIVQADLRIARGPSEQGVLTVQFAADMTPEQRDALAEAVASHPGVRFVRRISVSAP